MATAVSPQNPLEGFDKLAEGMHLYQPPTITETTVRSPDLVVICSWAFARERHIAKYLKGYKTLFPSSSILLLQAQFSNMVWRPEFLQIPLFQPAILAIQKYLDGIDRPKPPILMHLFSNGGSYTAVQLAQAFQLSTGQSLPISAVVLDSTPGIPPYEDGLKAVRMGVPKTFLTQWVIVPLVVGSLHILRQLGLVKDAHTKLYRVLNELDGAFLQEGMPRSYVYSETDSMIRKSEVERHAEAAKERLEAAGVSVDDVNALITLEEFIGSQHVNHISLDAERYWNIVRSTWGKRKT